jgi:hypothetical protein
MSEEAERGSLICPPTRMYSPKFRSEKTARTLSSKSTFCQLLLQTLTFPSSHILSQKYNRERGDRFYASTNKTTFNLLSSIIYYILPYQIMRESTSIQGHREGSPAQAIRSSVQDFSSSSSPGATRRFLDDSSSSLRSHENEISSPLKVERTRGVGRSRSMIVEARSVQGKRSHRRRGSVGGSPCLTFAFSIDSLPRAGTSRACSLDNPNPPPSPPQRQMSRKSIFLISGTPL